MDPATTSAIKVLSVTGKSAAINAELKDALITSERLRRCHRASGEKTFTVTIHFQVDAEGRVSERSVDGLKPSGSFFPRCITAFARSTVLKSAKSAGDATRVSVKARFELTRPKP